MSDFAADLLELQRLAHSDDGRAGSLTAHLLREYAVRIIAPGVESQLEGL
jgi:hypothetical protein